MKGSQQRHLWQQDRWRLKSMMQMPAAAGAAEAAGAAAAGRA